jgi:hypothetical protein
MRKRYAQEAFVWSIDLHAVPVSMTTVWISSLRCSACHDAVTSKIQHDGWVEGARRVHIVGFLLFLQHSCAVDVQLSSLSIYCAVLGARMR